ncbi:MAG TPA: tetratricopeptide repeat protein [Paucimonas sp.]|nr:tetratricopeptide repeat protein [Paucimonas sp.]
MSVRGCLRLIAALAAASSLAAAAAEYEPPAQQDLYLDAMHSISEGRQNEARDALTRMIEQEPQHAGAWLDLAIIQCELGHADEAERLFQAIEARFAPPPGIREVIAAHRATGCQAWRPHSQLSLAVARGVDDNVNQGASNPNFSFGSGSTRTDLVLAPEYLPQRDHYTLLSTDYARDLTRGGITGFAQLRIRRNDSLSNYDTASLQLGIERPWRIGTWDVRGIGALGALTLGDRLYQRQGQLQLRAAPTSLLPKRWNVSLTAGATHLAYPTLTNFDSNTFELSASLIHQGTRLQTQASAGYLLDHGKNVRPGGDRKGWFGGLQGRLPIRGNWIGEFGWTRQHWLSQASYSPGLIDQARHQDTQLLRAGLTIPFKERQTLQIEIRQVKNNENISIFQYNSRLLQMSWQWQPF